MANRVGTFSGSTNGTTAQWTELGGGGAIIWEGEESLVDEGPKTFNFNKTLKDGDIISVLFDINTDNNFKVTGFTQNLTFQAIVGETLSNVNYVAFYDAGGSSGGTIRDIATLQVDCGTSRLMITTRGGEMTPTANRFSIRRIYKVASGN
jgi:hypothetical protein